METLASVSRDFVAELNQPVGNNKNMFIIKNTSHKYSKTYSKYTVRYIYGPAGFRHNNNEYCRPSVLNLSLLRLNFNVWGF